jgi:hypothetical protein
VLALPRFGRPIRRNRPTTLAIWRFKPDSPDVGSKIGRGGHRTGLRHTHPRRANLAKDGFGLIRNR